MQFPNDAMDDAYEVIWVQDMETPLDEISAEDQAADIAELNSVSLSYDQVRRGYEAWFADENGQRGSVSSYVALVAFCRAEGLSAPDAVGNALIYRASMISSYRYGGVDDPEALDRVAREVVTEANYFKRYEQRLSEGDLPY